MGGNCTKQPNFMTETNNWVGVNNIDDDREIILKYGIRRFAPQTKTLIWLKKITPSVKYIKQTKYAFRVKSQHSVNEPRIISDRHQKYL